MKRLFIYILVLSLFSISLDAQTTRKKPKKTPKKPKIEKPNEVALPPRSSDCFFAVNLMLDSTFGPTEPLQGFGYVNEIHQDSQTKNVFQQEHNSVWYKIDCPYAGKLIIDVTPRSEGDDYDMLVYKYTDRYFCNRVEKNRVKPVRSIMSAVNGEVKGKTGLSLSGTAANISKSSTVPYGRYIDVEPGESYIVVLDNNEDGGLGHSIRAEIYTQNTPLYIQIVDSVAKERMTANIRVKDVETDNEVMNLADVGNTKIKLIPKKNYQINITKQGYFNYVTNTSYEEKVGSKDSVLTVKMAPIKVGSVLKINGDLYFDVDDSNNVTILPDSYQALDEVAKILNDYPHLSVVIFGKISTEGVNLDKDTENSLKRADAIKNYLISKGVNEKNLQTRGSTKKELLAQIAEQNKKNRTIYPQCELLIKSVK